MKITIEDYDYREKLSSIISHVSSTGNIAISLYPNEENWINANNALPYVYLNGRIEWNVPIQQITFQDIIKTIQLNDDCEDELEIEESSFCIAREINLVSQVRCFVKFWKNEIKNWSPKSVRVSSKALKRFLLKTEVPLLSVFRAIWMRRCYELDEFCKLFSISKKQGKEILRAAGYEKKTCNTFYMLIFSRRTDIENCIKKSEIAVSRLGKLVEFNSRVKNNIASRIIQSAERKKEWAMRFSYMSNCVAECDEPAFGKRKEWVEHLWIAIISFGMVIFAVVVCGMFFLQIKNSNDGKIDSIFGFWSGIIGALISGIVTIFTTLFIIRRSYKVDYHMERIAVLPLFSIEEVFHDYSIDEKLMPKKIRKFEEKHVCSCICGNTDVQYTLVKIKNMGRGPAFHIEISGTWPDYEDELYKSILVGECCYIAIPHYSDIKIKLSFYDLYGNYYFQSFQNHENYAEKYMVFGCDAPELVLRTNRIRYRQ